MILRSYKSRLQMQMNNRQAAVPFASVILNSDDITRRYLIVRGPFLDASPQLALPMFLAYDHAAILVNDGHLGLVGREV